MDILSIVSLVTGIVSIVLAIVAIFFSAATAKKSQYNFNRTQEIMQTIYEKTKDALADIDKKSAIIETVVQKNQDQMLSTITNLINETIIPKKPDMSEQFGMQFMQGLLQNPTEGINSIKGLVELAEIIKKNEK